MRGWAFSLAMLALAACARFDAGDPPVVSTEAGVVDAGKHEASTSIADAGPKVEGDAGADAEAGPPPNLEPTGGFEDGAACGGGWTSHDGIPTTLTDERHAGTHSCRVCVVKTKSVFTLDGPAVAMPVSGQIYTATAWVKSDGAQTLNARLVMRAWNEQNGDGLVESDNETVQLANEDWTQLKTTLVLDAPTYPDAFDIDAYVQFDGFIPGFTLQPCVFVDEVVVHRQ